MLPAYCCCCIIVLLVLARNASFVAAAAAAVVVAVAVPEFPLPTTVTMTIMARQVLTVQGYWGKPAGTAAAGRSPGARRWCTGRPFPRAGMAAGRKKQKQELREVSGCTSFRVLRGDGLFLGACVWRLGTDGDAGW